MNISGGKWIIRLRKGVADRLWEDLILAVIGDQFDECNAERKESVSREDKGDSNGSEWPEICGCTISVRQSEDIVTLWNRVDADAKVREKIRCVVENNGKLLDDGFLYLAGRRSGRCSIYPSRPPWSINPIMVSIKSTIEGSQLIIQQTPCTTIQPSETPQSIELPFPDTNDNDTSRFCIEGEVATYYQLLSCSHQYPMGLSILIFPRGSDAESVLEC